MNLPSLFSISVCLRMILLPFRTSVVIRLIHKCPSDVTNSDYVIRLCGSRNTLGHTWSVQKVMRMNFYAAQEVQERRVVVVVDGGGTLVYSMTFLSWVRAFVAVGASAKCVVVLCLVRAKMQRSLEQRHEIKFCAKLGKSGPKRCSCWGQLKRMLFCVQPKSSGGTRRSRVEGRALRTNSAQAVFQLQELRTTWLVWRLIWIGIGVCKCG